MKRAGLLIFVPLVLAACADSGEVVVSSTQQELLGYPTAHWKAADPSNYTSGDRGVGDITHVVVHTMSGSYSGSQSWFQDPVANVSAHYLIRSSDGDITQMVDDSDYAWHVFCLNEAAIGIEHEGYDENGSDWYTDVMYDRSARLTAWLVNQYLIPLDRDHIMGHDESGCTDHTDPGADWNWNHYMDLVEQYALRTKGASLVSVDAPERLTAGEFANVTFELSNDGNYTWAQDKVLLGTQDPQDHVSPFGNPYWLAPNRARGPVAKNNYAGEVISFTFPIQAPAVTEATTISETLQLSDEEGAWFGPKVSFSIEILPGEGSDSDPNDPTDPNDTGSDAGEGGGGCAVGNAATGSGLLLVLMGLLALRRRRE